MEYYVNKAGKGFIQIDHVKGKSLKECKEKFLKRNPQYSIGMVEFILRSKSDIKHDKKIKAFLKRVHNQKVQSLPEE